MRKKRALAHLGFRHDEEWRDWPNLPTVLIDDIAGRLLRYDVAAYLRLRAACREWRACTVDPTMVGDLDSRFRPRHWIMLSSSSQPEDARRQFINTSTGACAHVHLPELSGHHLETYTQGLLLLWRLKKEEEEEEAAVHVRLLNPLTRALTDLPPITAERRSMYVAWKSPVTSRLVYAGISDETSPPTVVLFMSSSMCSCIAYAKPGDQRWALMDKECWKSVPTMNSSKEKLLIYIHYVSVLTMRGCIYLPTKYGNILKVSIHPKPQLVPVVVNQPFDVCAPNTISYLVPPASDDDDTMLMVRYYHTLGHLSLAEQRKMKRRKEVIKVPISARRYSWNLLQVLKVDVAGGRIVPVVDIGRRALFIGDVACLSISTETFPSVAGNAVHLGVKSICSTFFGVRYLLDRTIDPPFKFAQLQAVEKKPFQRSKGKKAFLFSGCNLKPPERKIVLAGSLPAPVYTPGVPCRLHRHQRWNQRLKLSYCCHQ